MKQLEQVDFRPSVVGFGSLTADIHLGNDVFLSPYEAGGKTIGLPGELDPDHVEFIGLGGNVFNVLDGVNDDEGVFRRVSLATVVGESPRGQVISRLLGESSLDTTHVFRDPDHKDGLSIIQYSSLEGDRHVMGAPRDAITHRFAADDIRAIASEYTHLVLTASKDPDFNDRVVDNAPQEVAMSLNPSSNEIESGRTLDTMLRRKKMGEGAMLLLAVNETEAAALLGSDRPHDLREAGRLAVELTQYADNVLVTMSHSGLTLAVDGDHVPYARAPASRPRDPRTLGAGDAAHGRTLWGVAAGEDPANIVEKTLERAGEVLAHKSAQRNPGTPIDVGSIVLSRLL